MKQFLIITTLIFCLQGLTAQEDYIEKRRNGFDFSSRFEVGNPLSYNGILKYGRNKNKLGLGYHISDNEGNGSMVSYYRLL